MECRDVRELADSLLDRERVTEANHEILRHLNACPVCRADVAGRRALREGVRRAFENARELDPTPEFTTRLQTTLERVARVAPLARSCSARGTLHRPTWWSSRMPLPGRSLASLPGRR